MSLGREQRITPFDDGVLIGRFFTRRGAERAVSRAFAQIQKYNGAGILEPGWLEQAAQEGRYLAWWWEPDPVEHRSLLTGARRRLRRARFGRVPERLWAS